MKSGILVFVFLLVVGAVGGAILYNAQTVDNITSEIVTIKQNPADSAREVQAGTAAAVDEEQSQKILIAYFSRTGNTREMATQIQAVTAGDMHEIEPVVPCPEDYDECKEFASRQKEEDARPEVVGMVENMDEYDVVFVGYPLWLSTMPMYMFTFLESYDFSDKTVIPFCTSGSGKIGESEADIAKLLPNADIRDGLVIKGDEVVERQEKVENWIDELDIISGKKAMMDNTKESQKNETTKEGRSDPSQDLFSEGEEYTLDLESDFVNKCKEGLVPIVAATNNEVLGCGYPACNCFVCSKCGNGECGLGENVCNCPDDCDDQIE